jgi:hypothetical protein
MFRFGDGDSLIQSGSMTSPSSRSASMRRRFLARETFLGFRYLIDLSTRFFSISTHADVA